MVTERAVIHIVPGQEDAFEETFPQALPQIASGDGFVSLQLARGVESTSKYLLSVGWESVDAHLAFRDTEKYAEWRRLLHPFFDPQHPPQVDHTTTLVEV
jgi:heme-degrading monooxygenase HmoA